MPDWRNEVRARLSSLRLSPSREADIVDELAQHLDDRYRELLAGGASPEEAARLALGEFESEDSLAQHLKPLRQAQMPAPITPGAATGRLLSDLWQDIRGAVRGFRKQPGFAVAAIVTLALGIGATTAIFSVVYSVLIKPLPYPNADELVSISYAAPGANIDNEPSDTTMYLTYRDENRTFASIGLWKTYSERLSGKSELVNTLGVTDGTLQVLGVQPMLGRWFTQREYEPAAEGPEPVILSYAFWQRQFGGDEAVLGREISIDDLSIGASNSSSRQWRVIGIMPRGFRFLDRTRQPDAIAAWQLDPAKQAIGNFSYGMLGRLKPGVTLAEARADVERMLPIWLDAWPFKFGASAKKGIVNSRITPVVRPLKDDLVGGVASTLWLIMGAIGAVLLIACANIANLMLVRADARRPEFAVRGALGAAPARIARELLIESLVLGAIGGALGLVLAYVGVQLLVANGPSDLPRLAEIAVYPPVLAFTVAVSLASTVVFGSIPALKHALHMDTPMSGPMRGASASRERSTTRSALVVVQVAFALVLVISAALMIRSFQALRDVDPGFSDPATIQTAYVWIPFTDPQRVIGMEHEILDSIAALPGVASVGFARDVPMDGSRTGGAVLVEGETIAAGEAPPSRRLDYVSPGYFEAMGTRIIAGRDITWNDIQKGGGVALISENFAREIAGSPAAALGRRIRFSAPQASWHEVVGVVQNVHQYGLYEDPPVTVYWPVLIANRLAQQVVNFVIRSERGGTASFAQEVRQAIRSVNGSIVIAQERTMQDLYAESLARTSFTLVMLAIAGSMALALGVVGIYGVIAYTVSRRTREIGIRSALGAEPRQLKRMILLHGLALSGVGAVVGLVGPQHRGA